MRKQASVRVYLFYTTVVARPFRSVGVLYNLNLQCDETVTSVNREIETHLWSKLRSSRR